MTEKTNWQQLTFVVWNHIEKSESGIRVKITLIKMKSESCVKITLRKVKVVWKSLWGKWKLRENHFDKSESETNSMKFLWRYVLAWMGCFGIMNVYFCRINLSVAMVAMVGVEEVEAENVTENSSTCSSRCLCWLWWWPWWGWMRWRWQISLCS